MHTIGAHIFDEEDIEESIIDFFGLRVSPVGYGSVNYPLAVLQFMSERIGLSMVRIDNELSAGADNFSIGIPELSVYGLFQHSI